jgi:hypothetical protein
MCNIIGNYFANTWFFTAACTEFIIKLNINKTKNRQRLLRPLDSVIGHPSSWFIGQKNRARNTPFNLNNLHINNIGYFYGYPAGV